VARKVLGPQKILGVSCGSLADVTRADQEKIDYLGFGPVFATALKPGIRRTGPAEFRKAQKISRLPVFGIGGITAGRLRPLRSAGQPLRIAVCRPIVKAGNIGQAVKKIKKALMTGTSHV
jgi:thiamine-phosphate pyrophosphorylase